MKTQRRSLALPWVIAVGLTVLLVALAVLQYRWIGEISQAEGERLRANLDNSAFSFRSHFTRELLRICSAFQVGADDIRTRNWERVGLFHQDRFKSFHSAGYISAIYLQTPRPSSDSTLLKLNFENGRFEEVPWPARFAPLGKYGQPGPGRDRRVLPGRSFSQWTLEYSIPALTQQLTDRPPMEPGRGEPPNPGPPKPPDLVGSLIVELDFDAIRKELLPEIAGRYFGGPDGFVYRVAVIGGRGHAEAIYQSDQETLLGAFDSADLRMPLLLEPGESFRRTDQGRPPTRTDPSPQAPLAPPGGENPGPPADFRASNGVPPQGRPRLPGMLAASEDGSWILAVKHIQGSVGDVVARVRRNNLAISSGILLLLVASIAILIVSSQRAARLAKLQMDFVTGVSHELRTPLAVIHAAAENLADGVVHDSDMQIRQYGELVRDETRRLSNMLEQVLQYSRSVSGQLHLKCRPSRVDELVESAISDLRLSIHAAGVDVETHVEANLEPVVVDPEGLVQCLRNLLSNAIKYGASGKKISVTAREANAPNGREAQISVEDFGNGIASVDLPFIFDAFYRGDSATSGQVEGSGLGLSLTRDLMQAMRGRVSVRNKTGHGCVFTLHVPLRAAEKPAQVMDLEAADASGNRHG